MKFSDDGTHLVDQIVANPENVFTWDTKPLASQYTGSAWFSDIGAIGYSDGTNWALVQQKLNYTDGTVALANKSEYGWSFVGGARAPILHETVSGGVHVILPLNTDDSTNNYSDLTMPDLGTPVLFPRSFSLRVYSSDWSKVSRIVTYMGTAAYAKFFNKEFNPNSSVKFSSELAGNEGWRTLSSNYSEWTNTGSPNFTSDLLVVQKVRVYSTLNNSADLIFGELRYNCTDAPTISICSDDGYESFRTIAGPLLAARGLKASLAVIPDKVGSAAKYATWDGLRSWVALGNNCVTHGVRGALSSLQDYATLQERVDDCTWSRAQIQAQSCDVNGSSNFYVFPEGKHETSGGAFNDRNLTSALLANGFTGGRSGFTPYKFISRFKKGDESRMLIPVIGHGWSATDQAGNITAILAHIDDCANYGISASLMFHEIANPATTGIHITTADFTTIINKIAYWVNQGKLTNVFINEHISSTITA